MNKEMPISSVWDYKNHIRVSCVSVPWNMICSHNEQAKINHCGQSLDKLRNRGGLSACEAIAILEDHPWSAIDKLQAIDILTKMIDTWKKNLS